MKLVIKHCLKSGGAMRQYCEIVAVKKIDFVIKTDVKDIHERDIFDIRFCGYSKVSLYSLLVIAVLRAT